MVVPDGVGWGREGQLHELEYDEAYIRLLVVYIGNIAGDSLDSRIGIVGAVRLRTVEYESGEGCILPLERGLGRKGLTLMSLVAWAAVTIPTASSLAATIATTPRLRLLTTP